MKELRKMLRLNYRERREREFSANKYEDRAAKRRKVLKGVPENSKVSIPDQLKISNAAFVKLELFMLLIFRELNK